MGEVGLPEAWHPSAAAVVEVLCVVVVGEALEVSFTWIQHGPASKLRQALSQGTVQLLLVLQASRLHAIEANWNMA